MCCIFFDLLCCLVFLNVVDNHKYTVVLLPNTPIVAHFCTALFHYLSTQFGDGKRLMSVFGKDSSGSMQKLSIHCEDAGSRDELFQLISQVISTAAEK